MFPRGGGLCLILWLPSYLSICHKETWLLIFFNVCVCLSRAPRGEEWIKTDIGFQQEESNFSFSSWLPTSLEAKLPLLASGRKHSASPDGPTSLEVRNVVVFCEGILKLERQFNLRLYNNNPSTLWDMTRERESYSKKEQPIIYTNNVAFLSTTEIQCCL